MSYLLDTHALIWFLNGDDRIPNRVIKIIEDKNNLKFVSIASYWEISIKFSLGKFKYEKGLKAFFEMISNNGFLLLPIEVEHTLVASSLDFIHKDPFDRILIAQAMNENFTVLTFDKNIIRYKVETFW